MDTSIRALLLKRFPGTTPEALDKAHAYAYGGCIIQDMGYYPFSSRFFSDLMLSRSAHSSTAADTEGHRIGGNRAVPKANVDAGGPGLPDENLHVGEPPQAGKYKKADVTYEKLVG